jgi:hypothetical protein
MVVGGEKNGSEARPNLRKKENIWLQEIYRRRGKFQVGWKADLG